MTLAERLEANAILDRLVAGGPTFFVSDARRLIALIPMRNPDPTHPLRGRVIPIALAVLEAQVLAADAAEARLLAPFPELVPLYEARGYRRVADRPDLDYLRKQRTAP